MSDRIAIMNGGRIEQVGAPREIYERPGTAFVARFLGEANLLAGTVESVAPTAPSLLHRRRARCRARAEPGDRGRATGSAVRAPGEAVRFAEPADSAAAARTQRRDRAGAAALLPRQRVAPRGRDRAGRRADYRRARTPAPASPRRRPAGDARAGASPTASSCRADRDAAGRGRFNDAPLLLAAGARCCWRCVFLAPLVWFFVQTLLGSARPPRSPITCGDVLTSQAVLDGARHHHWIALLVTLLVLLIGYPLAYYLAEPPRARASRW